MARASFVLRRPTTNKGSYLQYPIDDPAYAARTDNDNYLRGDALQLAPAVAPIIGGLFLEAVCTSYDTVVVRWNVALESTLGASPVAHQMIITYSEDEAPRTINKGETLVETYVSGTGQLTQSVRTISRWGYYTLFIRYVSTGGDDYYEPMASVKVFIPGNYNSVESLYARIPEYYRNLDEQQNTEGNPNGGPLKRFLSVFGWELDHHRSLIDYVITMKDPQLSDQAVLNALSVDFGIGLLSSELGAGRLRQILNSIGDIQRGKGTIEIVERTLRLLTECSVEYNPSASPVPTIKVYAQRVNLISDPRLSTGVTGSIDGGSPTSTYLPGFTLDAGVVGTSQADGTYDGGDSVTPDYSATSPLSGGWSSYPDQTNSGFNILERTTLDIKAIGGDVFYFSTHASADIQDLISEVMLYATAGYSELTGVEVVSNDTPVVVGNTKYWRLEVPDTYTTYTDMGIVIRFADSPIYSADAFDYLLLERNTIGEYFDGDSVRGGWIVDGGGSVSDFSWTGTEGESQSTYTDNLQRAKYAVARLIPSILPVTQLVTSGTVYSNRVPTTNLKYAISWNNIPGV